MRVVSMLCCLLAGCDVLEPMPEICTTIPEGGDALCPQPDSPIAYSMLGPNVHLVVDRSGSMNGHKWNEVEALTSYLPMVGTRANLALTLFSSPNGSSDCSIKDANVVEMSEGNRAASRIADEVAATFPHGLTPIAKALKQVRGSDGLSCPNRDNIVVLLTDGEESCGGDPVKAAADLATSDPPVELYVIGFGTNAAIDASLSEIAAAAAPSTGTDNFYTASTVEELVMRLGAVTGTCIAQLLDGPMEAEDLLVTLDGRTLEPCTDERCAEGFTTDFEHGTVHIEGDDCLQLLDGTCHELVFDAL